MLSAALRALTGRGAVRSAFAVLPAFAAAAIVAVLCAGGLARAQDSEDVRDDLELLREEEPAEVVEAASKTPQLRRSAAAAVSVLTGDDLRRYGYRTVAEAIRGLTGFQVSGGRDFDFIGVRGLGLPGDFNTRILVTLNGHTMNEVWNNSSQLGEDFGVDIGIVERIEVIIGPSSSLYGQGAFLASVHVTTKTGADLEYARATTEVGSFGLVRTTASVGHAWSPNASFLLSAYYLRREGEPLHFPEYVAAPTGGYSPASADRSNGYGFLAHVKLGDFTLHGKYSQREQGLAFAPFGSLFGDPQNAVQESRGFAEARYDRSWKPGGALKEATFTARAYFDHYRYDDFLRYDNGVLPLQSTYTFRDAGSADWYGAEVRAMLDFGRFSRLVVGVEYTEAFDVTSHSFVPLGMFTRPPAGGEARDTRVSTPFTGAAGFLQDELKVHEKVTLVGGVRFDAHSRFQRALSPRAGVLVQTGENSDLKLLYGVGFRNPSVYEAYFADGVDIAANPALRAERIHTGQVVYEHKLRGDLRLRADLHYSLVRDLITLVTISQQDGERRQFQNSLLDTQIFGGEVRLQYRPDYGLLSYLSVALQRARQDGSELPNSPGVLLSAGFSAPLVKERFYAGLEGHLVGARLADDARSMLDPYLLLHLHLYTTKILGRVSISAKVYNLLDARYGEIPRIERTLAISIPGPRRTFMLKADIDW